MQTDRQSVRETGRQAGRKKERQEARMADRGRQTDRLADRRWTLQTVTVHLALLSFQTSAADIYPSVLFIVPLHPVCAVTLPPRHRSPLTRDRLGSRGGSGGGTEVEGEAIYPRRIRRCVTEVWTVAAGQ